MISRLVFGTTYSVQRAATILFLLLLPSVLFLSNSPVWDDLQLLNTHAHWSMDALLGQYLGNKSAYWRPLTVLTVAIPQLLHVPLWANKLLSVVLFYGKGLLALAIADSCLRTRGPATSNVPLIALAAVFALHPLFVESSFWLAARADLLLSTMVLWGTWRLIQSAQRQERQLPPGPVWRTGLVWFAITVLACGAKETGFVWAAMAAMVAILALVKLVKLVKVETPDQNSSSHQQYQREWLATAIGVVLGGAIMLGLRTMIMHSATGSALVVQRHLAGSRDTLQVFCEFLFRSVVDIFVPVIDQTPFKSSGWLDGYPPVLLILLLVAPALLVAWIVIRTFQTNKIVSAMLAGAVVVIALHGVSVLFTETTIGTVFSPRYIDPSVALIMIALALSFWRHSAMRDAVQPAFINWPVAGLFAILLVQSLAMWSGARLAWENNFSLWQASWDNGARGPQVTSSYAFALAVRHHFPEARALAINYEQQLGTHAPTNIDCMLYTVILDADLTLPDPEDGRQQAWRALPMASCTDNLATNVATFLADQHCEQVLPMLNRALAADDSARNAGGLIRIDPVKRTLTIVDTASAEARCGDRSRAAQLIARLAETDPDWALDSQQAQSLLNQPRVTSAP